MAVFLPEEILHNILARLPTKPLLRCRCVCKYWHRLLTEPYFMKLRSHTTIILPLLNTCLHLDDNVPNEDTTNSIINRCYPLADLLDKYAKAYVIGTFDGIVVLCYDDAMILYNPFTGASKLLPDAPDVQVCAYGFGYGTTPDDLKIVRLRLRKNVCDVYSFKSTSWTTSQCKIQVHMFINPMGTFLNGFLHWVDYYYKPVLLVLNVKDMVLSETDVPFKRGYDILLGTIGGCLCLLNQINKARFKIWVMKEHGVWSMRYSFELPVELDSLQTHYNPICILDSGRILMVNLSQQPIIYDPLKNSCKTFDILLTELYYRRICGLEYVESLLSPSDLCSSLRLKKKRKQRIKRRAKDESKKTEKEKM